MKIRAAFTIIELIFVIVVMGILAKFGVEFLARAYESFIYSSTNNTLQAKTASAVEFVANRLQYRLKESVIVRTTAAANATPLANANGGLTYEVLEWIPEDIDGFRGTATPLWSGIIDLDAGIALGNATLVSPATNTVAINALIGALSDSGSGINDAALYFLGANNNPTMFGWDGAITDQSAAIHPIQSDGTADRFYASTQTGMTVTNFSGTQIFEYYKLAWTANAIAVVNNNLIFYYDYQPWRGETFTDGKAALLMEDVSTFQARAVGSIMKLQICAKSDVITGKNGEGSYSLCKEKTIY